MEKKKILAPEGAVTFHNAQGELMMVWGDVHTEGRKHADAIIVRRLEKCLNDGKGHLINVDRHPCPRCGINRIFAMENDYHFDNAGRIMGVHRNVTALL